MKITKEQKENAVKMARENQMNYGMSCSESVFNALIRSGIIDLPEDYTRIATGLSGGVAASGNTCGAIYGGLMALGVGCMEERTPLNSRRHRIHLSRRNSKRIIALTCCAGSMVLSMKWKRK